MEQADTDDGAITATIQAASSGACFQLSDETLRRGVAEGVFDHTHEMSLNVQLRGSLAASRVTLPVDVEELVRLVESLREINCQRTTEASWATHCSTVEIHLSVLTQKLGPPVRCEVWLRDSVPGHEEHHCSFETDLSWFAAFLTEVERMALRYGRARAWLNHD